MNEVKCDCGTEGWIGPHAPHPPATPTPPEPKRWALDLICCGLDDGTVIRSSWDEANDLRESYTASEGHRRSALLRETRPDEDQRASTFVLMDRPHPENHDRFYDDVASGRNIEPTPPEPPGERERFDHDGTYRHHHDVDTAEPIWWQNCEQFGGEKVAHKHHHREATPPEPGLSCLLCGQAKERAVWHEPSGQFVCVDCRTAQQQRAAIEEAGAKLGAAANTFLFAAWGLLTPDQRKNVEDASTDLARLIDTFRYGWSPDAFGYWKERLAVEAAARLTKGEGS
jgi:hypothetical protein